MTGATLKTCVVAYATPERQHLWTVELPREATIADAIEAARIKAEGTIPTVAAGGTSVAPSASDSGPGPIPWSSAPVGIFGEIRARDHVPEDGDRIELYRALKDDPRERRRQRVNAGRRGRY